MNSQQGKNMDELGIVVSLFEVLLLVVVLYLREVFVYVSSKLNIYISNSFCQEELQHQTESKSQQCFISKSFSIFTLPIIQVLSQCKSNKNYQVIPNNLSLNQSQTKHQCETISSFHRFLWPSTISVIFCIIVPILLLWQQKQIKSVIFSYNISDDKVIYANHLPVLINLGQVISNIIFLTLLIRQAKTQAQQAQCQTQAQARNSNTFKPFQISLYLIMILLNPLFISLYLVKLVISINSQSKTQTHKISIIASLTPFLLLSIIFYLCIQDSDTLLLTQYYTSLVFPSKFLPQTNLIWIFYSHMFNRYLTMYQMILFLLPISTSIPLALLNINYHTKILVQYFIVVFTSYNSSYFNLYIFWSICVLCLPKFSSYKNQVLIKINRTLAFVAFIGSTFFFLSYQKLTQMYLNSWMVNIGYPFVFGSIAWTLIVIWLAQLIKIELDQIAGIPYQDNHTDNKNLIQKIVEKTKQLVKFKLWTKNPPISPNMETQKQTNQHDKVQ